jgi:hypothetical protein
MFTDPRRIFLPPSSGSKQWKKSDVDCFDSEEGGRKSLRNLGINFPIDTVRYHSRYASQTFRLHTSKDTAFMDQQTHSEFPYKYSSYKPLRKGVWTCYCEQSYDAFIKNTRKLFLPD